MPTPGTPDYAAIRQQAQASNNQAKLLGGACSTDINDEFSIVAAPPTGDPGDFYDAIAEAHMGSISPYPIYLCEGRFPLYQTAVVSENIIIYGQGMDVSTIYQAEPDIDIMGGMFSLNDNKLLEFHNVTVSGGRALSVAYGATYGGAIKIYSGTLGIYDSKFEDNQAYYGGAIALGVDITIDRSIFLENTAVEVGGALYVYELSADCGRFDTNEATNDAGGAIFVDANGSITNSLFRGNTAGGDGAQIYNYYTETPTVAEGNEWGGSSPQVPGDISDGVDADPEADHDPTGDKECGYHINAIDDGIRGWSAFEKQSISDGLTQIGLAFVFLAETVDTREAAFNLAMLEDSGTEILFIRTDQSGSATVTLTGYTYLYGDYATQSDDFAYTGVPEGYCFTFQEVFVGFVLRPAAVVCNGDLIDQYSGTTQTLEASQYTIVHELGHVFDYRTEYGLSTPIDGSFVLEDCTPPPNTGTVMGLFQSSWTRGRRGWGTGPAQYYNAQGTPVPLVTDFQQNSANIPLEAAADSFLNWVYRLDASGPTAAVDPCTVTPTPWAGPGFLNAEWSATPHPNFIADSAGIPGTPDASLPGDGRHFDIDVRIRAIFSTNGW